MKDKVILKQLTKHLAINEETYRIYDMTGQYVGHLDLNDNQFVFNSDLPEVLRAEVGVLLMWMDKLAEEVKG
tara:strand:- start:1419 stop:1634 length:216 start_codon:yes stop_codon:yes gene_type:complete